MTGRLLVRGATLVRPDGGTDADILVEDGVVVAIGRDLAAPAGATEFDAAGLHAFPGAVDTHVHFNEPGRADWEGLATGSRALVAGGGTTFGDMPLNNLPLTLDGPSFDEKVAIASRVSHADFALWEGWSPATSLPCRNSMPVERLRSRRSCRTVACLSSPHPTTTRCFAGWRLRPRLG